MSLLVPVPAAEVTTLDELADEIRREHELCVFHVLTALEHAIHAGVALLRAREVVGRGQWERWLDENCPSVARQAKAYMRVATYRDAIPGDVGTLTEALRELRGLPAFDGSGPSAHPPEVRERALHLLGEGLSQRLVASVLGIDRKAITRWATGREGRDPGKRAGSYRTGRPTKEQRQERQELIRAEQRRAFGPAALANCFRSVWEAHRQSEQSVLVSALYELANTAVDWAEQLEAAVDAQRRAA
jgi:transposase